MALFERNRKLSGKQLRWFAGLWFPAFWGMIGAIAFRRFQAPNLALWIWWIAGILGIAGLLSTRIIRPVYGVMMWLAFPIGWLMSHVVLFAIYFLVITPIGLVVRRFQDPMDRRFDRSAKSYWKAREAPALERYFRQV